MLQGDEILSTHGINSDNRVEGGTVTAVIAEELLWCPQKGCPGGKNTCVMSLHVFLLQGTKLHLQPFSAASAKSVCSEWMTRWPLSSKCLTGEVMGGEGLEVLGCLGGRVEWES